MSVKLLFLGELCLHKTAFLPFLSTHGYDLTVINTSHWYFPRKIVGTDIPVNNLYENTKIGLLLKRAGWFGIEFPDYLLKALLYNLVEKAKLRAGVSL